MISFATLTYKRESILEEAIFSFLVQSCSDCEMVILNDNVDVEYVCDIPNVRIINHDSRFGSIGEKLKYCFYSCKNEYIYRLDDDDLLCEGAIGNLKESILKNPGYDIYRSQNAHFFSNNEYIKVSDNINNGNCYTKSYLNNIKQWDRSCDEDVFITFRNDAKIHTLQSKTMIYRWGMNTYHISGLGAGREHQDYFNIADNVGSSTTGVFRLSPHFKKDYYKEIGEIEQ